MRFQRGKISGEGSSRYFTCLNANRYQRSGEGSAPGWDGHLARRQKTGETHVHPDGLLSRLLGPDLQ